jgi:periplasmic divalent cation tolerance protein
MTKYKLAITTCPADEAYKLAREIAESRKAACVNVIENVHSIFHWKGNLETSRESILVMKTDEKHAKELQVVVEESHSYEVPEFVVFDIESGARAYLEWISDVLT